MLTVTPLDQIVGKTVAGFTRDQSEEMVSIRFTDGTYLTLDGYNRHEGADLRENTYRLSPSQLLEHQIITPQEADEIKTREIENRRLAAERKRLWEEKIERAKLAELIQKYPDAAKVEPPS
jgi:hypothetical protein